MSFLIGESGVLYLAVAQVTIDGEVIKGIGDPPDHEVPWALPGCSAREPQLQKALDVTGR